MRLAGVVLAVLLIAACPPRRARVVYVQPYPVFAPPVLLSDPTPAPPAETALDRHLAEWEKKTASVTNVRVEIALKRTDAVFKKETNFTGAALCMKPNFAILRLDNTADKADYEAYICDGKALRVYNGAQNTVTDVKLPPPWPFQWLWAANNPLLELLTGMKAKDLKERFDIAIFKTDDYYIYLDLKPKQPADQREFQRIRLALYGPGKATAKFAYLPASVYVLKPNGDSETWKFTNPQVNVPGVDAKTFRFVKPPDMWPLHKPPATGTNPEPVKP